MFAAFSALPQEQFLSWGWRMPFLFSIVLILFGLYIRARVSETPAFSEIAAKNKVARSPVKEAVRRHPREFLVVIGARLAENGLGYLFPVFALNYMTQQLHLPKTMVLQGNMLAYAVQLDHTRCSRFCPTASGGARCTSAARYSRRRSRSRSSCW